VTFPTFVELEGLFTHFTVVKTARHWSSSWTDKFSPHLPIPFL